jgi:hypothetical protein
MADGHERLLETYGTNPVLARSRMEIRNGDTSFDPYRRITRDRKLQRITQQAISAAAGECQLLEAVKPFPNANIYLRATPAQLASFVGANVRVYSVTDQTKTLEAEATITTAPTPLQGFLAVKIRARGGLDSLIVTIRIDIGQPLPQGELDVELVSFECGGDEEEATPAPPGPVPPVPVPPVPGGGFPVIFRVDNADFLVPVSTVNADVFERLLSATRTVTLPAAPTVGQTIVVKDEDGSLFAHDIVIDGNGQTIDGALTRTMTFATDGPFAAIAMIFTGAGWSII